MKRAEKLREFGKKLENGGIENGEITIGNFKQKRVFHETPGKTQFNIAFEMCRYDRLNCSLIYGDRRWSTTAARAFNGLKMSDKIKSAKFFLRTDSYSAFKMLNLEILSFSGIFEIIFLFLNALYNLSSFKSTITINMTFVNEQLSKTKKKLPKITFQSIHPERAEYLATSVG